jgi:hypothetical protein
LQYRCNLFTNICPTHSADDKTIIEEQNPSSYNLWAPAALALPATPAPPSPPIDSMPAEHIFHHKICDLTKDCPPRMCHNGKQALWKQLPLLKRRAVVSKTRSASALWSVFESQTAYDSSTILAGRIHGNAFPYCCECRDLTSGVRPASSLR